MQGAHRVNQELGAEEADATQNLHSLAQEANVEDRLGQLNVAKVAWALCHVPCRSGEGWMGVISRSCGWLWGWGDEPGACPGGGGGAHGLDWTHLCPIQGLWVAQERGTLIGYMGNRGGI